MTTLAIRPKEIRTYLYIGVVLALAGGFFDLVRGGITVSAMLLALAYCVLIPLAIWSGGRGVSSDDEAPPFGAAAIVALVVFVLYYVTMAPSTAMWDTSEYLAAAYTFGLPHPPGNPFFVIIGRVFSILPIAGAVAKRVNILAAICSAVSAGVWFLIADHVLGKWIESRWVRRAGAVIAAVVGATAFTVWNQSVVNEKVYTVSLVGIALVSWLMVRWSANPDDGRADTRLVLSAYLCGLGYANHMAGMLPAVAIAVAVLVRRPLTVLRWRLIASCVVAMVVGLTPFATQPIRAAYFPPVNEGEPTACRTALTAACTFSKGTYDAFMYNLDRRQFGKPALSQRQASFDQQIGMWWMYFRWQWLRDPDQRDQFLQSLLAALFLVLGLLGGWVHYRRDRSSFWYFGTLMFTTTLLLIYYLNFKLGFSQLPSSQAEHEVRDRDYFYLWSYSAWGIWAALGLVWVWETLAAAIGEGLGPKVSEARGWLYASPVTLLALVPLFGNWSAASRAGHYATRNMAVDLLNSVEPYGVLITAGDNDTFPLWYAQDVEGVRRDVVVVVTSLLGTDAYPRQIIRRPIYDYDAAKGPAIYRDKVWKKPTTSPLHMSFADADAVQEAYELPKPMPFQVGDLRATIDPKKLEYGALLRSDVFVLRMIQDSWPDRPIYFARSDAGYPQSLGLGQNVLIQGLASKVFLPPASPAAAKDTVFIEGDGWYDVTRSTALWNNVFLGQASIIREGQWVDRASAGMASLYAFAGIELADVLRGRGEPSQARKVLTTTANLSRAARLQNFLGGAESALVAPAGDSGAAVPLKVEEGAPKKAQSSAPTAKKP
ncbi:MAG: glycosyltransferase family 117 protein [Gemmatimonadaceae bacterium]